MGPTTNTTLTRYTECSSSGEIYGWSLGVTDSTKNITDKTSVCIHITISDGTDDKYTTLTRSTGCCYFIGNLAFYGRGNLSASVTSRSAQGHRMVLIYEVYLF
jgi:hypothetical protein